MVFGQKGGRSNVPVSHADSRNPLERNHHHHHQNPLQALKSMGDKLRPHTAVTTTEEEPGVSESDVPAGTAAPIAQHANQDAMNAGLRKQQGSTSGSGRHSIETTRSSRSFKSLISTKSKRKEPPRSSRQGSSPAGANHAGASEAQKKFAQEDKAEVAEERPNVDGSAPADDSSLARPDAAEHPEKYLNSEAGRGRNVENGPDSQATPDKSRLASTETSYKATSQQSERVRRVMQQVESPDTQARQELSAPSPHGPLSPRSPGYYVPEASTSPGNNLSASSTDASPSESQKKKSSTDVAEPKAGHVGSEPDSKSVHTEAGASAKDESFKSTKEDSSPSETASVVPTKEQTRDLNELNALDTLGDSVPGLSIGSQDPRLPGEKSPPTPSKNVDQSKVDKKFGTKKQQLARKRQLEAEYVGWRQIGGWDAHTAHESKEETDDLLRRTTLLEYYVNDTYIGDWYQNTALIVLTATMAWLVGHLGLSISWLSLILLFTATIYRTSVRRMRRNYRDDLVREQSLERPENDTETMEWLNSFLVKFWLIYEPSLSAMITQIGNEVLAEQTPGFIDSMSLEKFTLGTKAPRIEFVRSFPKTDAQVAVIDLGASFTPNDVVDLTARQLRTKVNPKIQLGIRVGKSVLSKHFPVLLEDMSFVGKMRLRIKLMERFPHIQTVDFSFLEPPEFDFVLKPIGGDTFGFDINIIPGLSKFIKDMVNANLGPMFYAPNAFQVNVEQLMAGVGIMTGVGVLSVKIDSAEELKRDQDGRVDPYVRILSKDKKELGRSSIKSDTISPVWNETLNVIVSAMNESVLLEILDFNDDSLDRSLGTTSLQVDKVIAGSRISRNITSGGHSSGLLKFEARFAPVQMPTDGDEMSGSRDTKSGILGLKVIGARELNSTGSATGKLSPFCEIEINGKLVDSTKRTKGTNNPEWGYAKEQIILNKLTTLLVFRVRDNRSGHHRSPQVAVLKIRLMELLVEIEKGTEWFQLKDGLGEIRLGAQWKPVNINVGGSASNYVEPIGVLRINVKHANNLRNLEHIGKVDPYTRVFLGNRQVARTDWFKNNLEPVWDQVLYVPVQSELQDLTLEVMDVEKRAKDRTLGAFKVDLGKIILKDDEGNYKVYISDKEFTNKLVIPNRGPKGTLTYTMEFYPAIPIVAPSERQRIHAERELIDELKAKDKELTPQERQDLEMREDRMALVGVDMPIEQQLDYKGGVFAFSVVALRNAELGQVLSVTANNDPNPVFVAPPVRSSVFVPDENGDFVSGQIALSSLCFELGTGDPTDRVSSSYEPAAELNLGCHELMKTASYQTHKWSLGTAELELQVRFFPVPDLVIDPAEDISAHGSVEVKLHNAKNVKAADPNGLSDPYVGFYLNNGGDRLYRSKTQKKTLNPVFDEQFRLSIGNPKETVMKALVYDWDMGNRDDYLGGVRFDLSELNPLEWRDYEEPLEMIKKTKDASKVKDSDGTLSLSMRFLPGKLPKVGDKDVIGAVNKVAGAGLGLAGAGIGAGMNYANSAAGHAAQHGQGLLSKLPMPMLHKDAAAEDEADLVSFSVSLESVVVSEHDNIQVRGFILGRGEKEVFKTQTLKVTDGKVDINETFDIRAFPDSELGVKLVVLKSLGRHSDIGQTSVHLSSGEKKADFGDGTSLIMHVESSG